MRYWERFSGSSVSANKAASIPFPVAVFPKAVQEIITATNECLNFPIDFIGASILAAVSVAVGNTHRIEIKTGWQESAVLYISIVGRPGTNKTHPLKWALKPIEKRDNVNYEKYNQEKLVSCLFGEHLLSKYPSNPVALAEAPKSAIYGTLYFGIPEKSTDLLWLAVYNLSSLTLEKCEVLKGRKVILFPDLSKDGKAYNMWEQKAREFQGNIPGAQFVMSDLLEKNASDEDREKGFDIADCLVRFDWRAFRSKTTKSMTSVVPVNSSAGEEEPRQADAGHLTRPNPDVFNLQTGKYFPYLGKRKIKAGVWPIDELVAFFETATLPKFPVRLDAGTEIIDVKKFIAGHVAVVRANNGNPSFRPFYDRLLLLKTLANILLLFLSVFR